jgi:hypothetical protein
MAKFRNPFGEDRICPTLGYILVPAGTVVTVPDEETEHWAAGGWAPVADPPAPAPAPAPVVPAAAQPAPEGVSA